MGLLVRSPALISILSKHKESSSSLVSKSYIEQDNLFSVFLFLINYHLMNQELIGSFSFNRCLSRVSILRIDNNSSPQMFFPFKTFQLLVLRIKFLPVLIFSPHCFTKTFPTTHNRYALI